jgi:hypothetical protein
LNNGLNNYLNKTLSNLTQLNNETDSIKLNNLLQDCTNCNDNDGGEGDNGNNNDGGASSDQTNNRDNLDNSPFSLPFNSNFADHSSNIKDSVKDSVKDYLSTKIPFP